LTLALKRLAAIGFLAILLFNFYGYKLVISYMQYNSNALLEKQVDKNNYNESDLITIKTKLNLPYYVSSDQYERAYGSIRINGINYQYVKRRVHNDTLELRCLPNPTATKLQSVGDEITKSFADGQASTPKKNLTIKITLPDFFQSFKTFLLTPLEEQKLTIPHYSSILSRGHSLKHKKPPKPGAFFC
jgi:hypothetical protein